MHEHPALREHAAHSFHLRLEPHGRGDVRVLEVPERVAYLNTPNGRPAGFSRQATRRGTSVQLEPVRLGRERGLVAVAPRRLRMRVNALPAPRIAFLRVGDEIVLDATAAFRVGEYRRRSFALASGDTLGRSCGSCRTPVAEGMHVFICACTEALHWEQPPKPEAERLECAVLASHCPSCRVALPSVTGEIHWGDPC